ncbi:MAG: GNAT family N-acetyltransferase [Thermoflexales bacterium]|nr:GNAT family N-acetyltransferase [Thermoflexales bacterium]
MLLETTTDQIFLPDAPTIAGLRFRTFRGDDDYAVIVEIANVYNAANQTGEIVTLDWLTNFYRNTPNFDPRRDVVFAEVDDRPIAYSRCWYRQLDDGTQLYGCAGYIVPEWARRGIGRAMLHHGEARVREIATTQADTGLRYYQSGAADTEFGADALLRSEGYAITRNFFEMVRPDLENIPDLPLPAGLEVRPATPDHYRAIGATLNEAFRDHWGHSEATEQEHQRWLNSPHFQPHLWQVAWAGDEVAGVVLPYINAEENAHFKRLRGWPDPICVRRPWRKQGLASALIARSLRVLKEHGMTEAALGVDTENLSGALRVYERLGFRAVKRFGSYWKPMRDE